MTRFIIRELGPPAWPDFARLVEKHNGIWGGCWCTSFHFTPDDSKQWAGRHREYKQKLVRANQSHAALVYKREHLVGWCQFGPPAELPARMTAYGRLGVTLPDWRITCFFVDRDRRKEGIAKTALRGALRIIASQGGGTVDGYPIVTRGKTTSNSFLWSGTASMFEKAGFKTVASLGKSKWIMRKTVRARGGR